MALSPMYTPGHNLVRDMFLEREVRTLLPDWEELAAQTAAALRAGADLRDPATVELVSSMLTDSRFRTLWANHDVRPSRNEIKRFIHPAVGPLTLRRQALSIAGAEDQVIITYQAEPGTASGDALARLL
jgi:transcription regulator MmyB-like protein